MGKKVYVGNLPYSATEESINAMFSEVGPVDSVNIITDRETGRSKGFGFVEMANEADVQSAIDKFNGQDMEGRPLTVNEARPREERGGGGGGRGGFGGGGGRGGGGFGGGGGRGGGRGGGGGGGRGRY